MNQEKGRKATLAFIFVTILVDVIGIAIIIPVFPTLIGKLTGAELNESAGYGGLLMLAFAAMQFVFAPIMGELSDRFGRRPVLLVALVGLGLDYFFHALAPSVTWLFVSRFIAGACGASFTVAQAYIADISTRENKARNFGMMGAAFGLGFFLGPMIGGVFAKWGPEVPFIVAGILAMLNFLWGIFVLPESLPAEKRRKIQYARMIPGVALANLGRYKNLLGFIVAFTLVHFAGQVMPCIWTFYTMEVFGWGEDMVGVSLGVVGFMVGLVQAVVIGWAVKQFGNRRVIMIGFILWTTGILSFVLAMNETLLFIALVPYVLGGIAGPTLQGIMSNMVSEQEQGNLQGVMTSLVSLTLIFSPPLYTGLFYVYSGKEAEVYFPAMPFLAGGIILIAATLVAWFSLKKARPEDIEPVIPEIDDASNEIIDNG